MPKDQGHSPGAEAREPEPTELELRFRIAPRDLQHLCTSGQLRAAPPPVAPSSRRGQPAYGVLPSLIFLSRVRRGPRSSAASDEPGRGRVRYIARPALRSALEAEAPAPSPADAAEGLPASGVGGGILELRLVSSEPKALFDAARELVAAVPVQITSPSQHGPLPERGADVAPWRDSAAVDLAPDAPVAEALAAVLDRGLDDLTVNAACLEGDDHPEIVHQMRVGLRRLRSFIRICRPALAEDSYALLRARLRELAAPPGPAPSYRRAAWKLSPTPPAHPRAGIAHDPAVGKFDEAGPDPRRPPALPAPAPTIAPHSTESSPAPWTLLICR